MTQCHEKGCHNDSKGFYKCSKHRKADAKRHQRLRDRIPEDLCRKHRVVKPCSVCGAERLRRNVMRLP